MDLSVVVPAYNEERRLGATLARLCEYLDERRVQQGTRYEILVVLDGCTDGSEALVRALAAERSEVIVDAYAPNRGKGAAVRRGLAAARGALVLFSDADSSTPIEELEKLAAAIERGADLAIGSRALPDSDVAVHQPWWREHMGKAFNTCVRAATGTPFKDTQCGFKCFRGEVARALAARQRIERFGFDVELLWIAARLGYAAAEVPVRWVNSPESTVHPVRDSLRMLVDLVRIRWNDVRGRYAADARGLHTATEKEAG